MSLIHLSLYIELKSTIKRTYYSCSDNNRNSSESASPSSSKPTRNEMQQSRDNEVSREEEEKELHSSRKSYPQQRTRNGIRKRSREPEK